MSLTSGSAVFPWRHELFEMPCATCLLGWAEVKSVTYLDHLFRSWQETLNHLLGISEQSLDFLPVCVLEQTVMNVYDASVSHSSCVLKDSDERRPSVPVSCLWLHSSPGLVPDSVFVYVCVCACTYLTTMFADARVTIRRRFIPFHPVSSRLRGGRLIP